jgi:hypothetical protein
VGPVIGAAVPDLARHAVGQALLDADEPDRAALAEGDAMGQNEPH